MTSENTSGGELLDHMIGDAATIPKDRTLPPQLRNEMIKRVRKSPGRNPFYDPMKDAGSFVFQAMNGRPDLQAEAHRFIDRCVNDSEAKP